MMQTHTVSFVPASVLIDTFIHEDWRDAFYEYVGQGWSWGDTFHTLVGNNEFFTHLIDFTDSVKMPLTDEQQDDFWAMVGYENFIDLET